MTGQRFQGEAPLPSEAVARVLSMESARTALAAAVGGVDAFYAAAESGGKHVHEVVRGVTPAGKFVAVSLVTDQPPDDSRYGWVNAAAEVGAGVFDGREGGTGQGFVVFVEDLSKPSGRRPGEQVPVEKIEELGSGELIYINETPDQPPDDTYSGRLKAILSVSPITYEEDSRGGYNRDCSSLGHDPIVPLAVLGAA